MTEHDVEIDLINRNWEPFQRMVRILYGIELVRKTDEVWQPDDRRQVRAAVGEVWWQQVEKTCYEARKVPRRSVARQTLGEIIACTQKLRPLLHQLDALLAPDVGGIVLNRHAGPEVWRNLQASGLDEKGSGSEYIDPLYGHLTALESFCTGFLEIIPRDAGGRTNLLTDLDGSWKAHMVQSCGRLFSNARPNDLTASESGPFYAVCCLMHEVLTGVNGDEEGVGMKRYVEYAVPWLKLRIEGFSKPLELALRRNGTEGHARRFFAELDDISGAVKQRLAAGPSTGRKAPRADAVGRESRHRRKRIMEGS